MHQTADTHTNPPKTVLVTGCSSGIGRCVALGLRAQGFIVYPTVRKEQDAQALQALGFEPILLDYSDEYSVQAAFDQLMVKTNHQLYGVFHNGAYGQPGAVEDISRRTLEKQFATNVFGWHQLNNLIIPIMRKQGYGRIIVNSSILGFVAFTMRGAYNASKFALEGLFDTLRLELYGSGIYVSLVEPGPIESHFRKNAKLAFEENLYSQPAIIDKSHYKDYYSQVFERLNKKENPIPFTLPPEAVLKKVLHALTSRRPRIRYRVTFPTHLFAILKRVLPSRWLDHILRKV